MYPVYRHDTGGWNARCVLFYLWFGLAFLGVLVLLVTGAGWVVSGVV